MQCSSIVEDAGKAVHGMNFGFNSNVRAGESLYHVQTEDRGPSHPFLDTVVYEAGRVIYKRSTSYADFATATKADDLPSSSTNGSRNSTTK